MTALLFLGAPVVVATCIATVVALIRKQSPGWAALLAGGSCVGFGLAFVAAWAVFANQSSTCDAFCGTGGRAFLALMYTLFGVVPLGLASAVSTAIVVATIRRFAQMTNRVIAAAIALAAATLIGLGVAFAFGAFSGASGPPGSVSDDCRNYATDKAKSAGIHDPIIKGIVGVGFQAGQTEPGAITLLKTLGTSYYVVSPFHDYAIVCVKPGFEQSWAAQLKAMDWVEYAHPEGVIPILTLPQ